MLQFLKLKHNLLDTGKNVPWNIACKTSLGKTITRKTTMHSRKFLLQIELVRSILPSGKVGKQFFCSQLVNTVAF